MFWVGEGNSAVKVTDVVRNLSTLGGAKWDVHLVARGMKAQGRAVLEMTIGEPDQPMLCPNSASTRANREGLSTSAACDFDCRINA